MTRLWLLLLLPLLLSGCPGEWIRVDDSRRNHQAERYTVSLPSGWVVRTIGDVLTVTRDGPNLQRVRIRASLHEDAFDSIERKSDKEMLPSELADLFIAALKGEESDGLPSLQVLSNEPVTVAGRDAFRLHAGYRLESGLEYQLLAVGFVTEKYFYVVSYTAPRLLFFERNKDEFEHILGTLAPI
ncbi:MAG: hypothetical protein KDI68_09815 [Gammaproteobacteria bacterium]|nr:hypothetical protein [Gammaproteobacteria bacterium]